MPRYRLSVEDEVTDSGPVLAVISFLKRVSKEELQVEVKDLSTGEIQVVNVHRDELGRPTFDDEAIPPISPRKDLSICADGDECPVCGCGTVERVLGWLKCRGECGSVLPVPGAQATLRIDVTNPVSSDTLRDWTLTKGSLVTIDGYHSDPGVVTVSSVDQPTRRIDVAIEDLEDLEDLLLT